MHVVVTGSAGFIGSHVVTALEGRGDTIVGVDPAAAELRTFEDVVSDGAVDRVVHLGAISSTLEQDAELLRRTNVELPQRIWRWCAAEGVPLVYASSGAVYGMGRDGFAEDAPVEPLNGYGRSKRDFDEWALAQTEAPPSWAGCRFFNVYGPNEEHKGAMASMASKAFRDVKAGRPTKLFKWGEQSRDFVWVGDVVDVVLWLMDADVSGVFNVGTGRAETFESFVSAVWRRCREEPRIDWIDMPSEIGPRYQSYTRAEMGALSAAGYDAPFAGIEDGVDRFAEALGR